MVCKLAMLINRRTRLHQDTTLMKNGFEVSAKDFLRVQNPSLTRLCYAPSVLELVTGRNPKEYFAAQALKCSSDSGSLCMHADVLF